MKYEALAPFYDRLMSHVEYDEWYSYICKIVKKHCGNKNPSVFEIGGGTGTLGKYLLRKGFNYTGSDLSYSMAHQAKEKGCPFLSADCRSLPIKKQFDMVIFLYDGINYLLSTNEYEIMFNEVHSILKENGLFLFDITTKKNSLRYFTDYFDYKDFDDYSYIRHSYFQTDTSLQINDFTIFKRVSNKALIFERFIERHIQKVFPPRIIIDALPPNKFNVIGIWDGFSFERYSSRSERIHFLLQRSN